MTHSTNRSGRRTAQHLLVGFFLLSATVLLSACTTAPTAVTEEQAPGMTTEKQGDTTLNGTLTKLDEKYYIQSPGQPQQEVDSYSIELDEYTGKSVSATGQFSGTTLFVGTITVQ